MIQRTLANLPNRAMAITAFSWVLAFVLFYIIRCFSADMIVIIINIVSGKTLRVPEPRFYSDLMDSVCKIVAQTLMVKKRSAAEPALMDVSFAFLRSLISNTSGSSTYHGIFDVVIGKLFKMQ